MFIDFKGAYDSLDRGKLLEIFRERIDNEWAEGLLSDLLKTQRVTMGGRTFMATRGVP